MMTIDFEFRGDYSQCGGPGPRWSRYGRVVVPTLYDNVVAGDAIGVVIAMRRHAVKLHLASKNPLGRGCSGLQNGHNAARLPWHDGAAVWH